MSTPSREQHPDLSPSQTACEWLVEALSPEALFEAVRGLGREIGELLPGFSLSLRALGRSSVRHLLARGLGRHPRLAGRICLSPHAPWQPWRQVFALLDEAWLRRHWRALVRHYGPSPAVALALEEREALRNRGDRMMRLASFWKPDASRCATLPPGWDELTKLLAPTAPAIAEGAGESRVPELERQLAQAREAADRWKRKHAETETQASQEQDRLREDVRQLRRELRAKEDELARFRDQFETRLHQQMAQLRERLFVAPAAPEPAELDALSLAEQAERVLNRQDALDRQRGTRSQVRAELDQLEEMEKRLRRSLAESLVLAPGLHETSIRVGQRLRELREALGEMDADSESPDLAAALLGRIKNAQLGSDATAELEHLKQILDTDVVRELLGDRVHGRLSQLERTHSQLAADRLLDATAGPATPSANPPEEREIWNLAERLGCHPPATVWLFVDGYNAIRRVGEWARIEQEQGLPAARHLLCELCRRHAHRFAHVEIVFDGTETTAATESCAGVRVVYSRAAGESQNADDHLVQRLHMVHDRADVTWLVTDDFGLRERVRNRCDAFVPPVLLQRFLLSPTS